MQGLIHIDRFWICTLALCPIFFILMQLAETFGRIIGWRQPPPRFGAGGPLLGNFGFATAMTETILAGRQAGNLTVKMH